MGERERECMRRCRGRRKRDTDKGKSQYNSQVYNIPEGDDHKPALPRLPQ